MFNLRRLDLNLLTVFEAVFEAGSVSRAAESLGLSQAAASHALNRLRQVCGDALFVRAGQDFRPTPAAQALFPLVQDALRLIRRGVEETRNFDPATSTRSFAVAIPHPLGPVIAQNLRLAALREAPGITLAFDTTTRPHALTEEMAAGRIDLAIDWLRIEQPRFVNTRLAEERLDLIARGGHPRIRPGAGLEALRREEFVFLVARRRREQRPRGAQELEALGLNFVLSVNEWLEIPGLVALYDLLGIVPHSLAPLLQARLGLQVLPLPAPLAPVPIYAVWHESRRQDPAHRWLRAHAAGELRRRVQAAS